VQVRVLPLLGHGLRELNRAVYGVHVPTRLGSEGLALPAMVRVTGDMRVGCGVSLLWRIAHFEAHPVC
jgi:hypothetical protein